MVESLKRIFRRTDKLASPQKHTIMINIKVVFVMGIVMFGQKMEQIEKA